MRIGESLQIAAAPATIWDLIGDPTELVRFSERLSVTPLDPDGDPGVGARYRVLLDFGAAPVGSNAEIVEYEPGRELAWTSLTGVDHRFRLRIRERGSGGSELTLRFGYDSPGALGTLADLAAFRSVRAILREAVDNLARAAEGRAAPPPRGPSPIARAAHELGNVGVLARAGIVSPMRPDKPLRMALAAQRWGTTLAAGVAANAIRCGDRPMLIDELGELSWAEADARTDAIAVGLGAIGVAEGDAVALLCRNHRGFVEAAVAAAKLGADVLLLNTGFAGPQIAEVCEREGAAALICDEEFGELAAEAATDRPKVLAWCETADAGAPTLERLCTEHRRGRPPTPGRSGRLTILTSGTTGTPKGATRTTTALTLDGPAGLFSRIPWRAGMTICLPAPLFHAWGLANFAVAMGLGSTVVLRRRFDPEAVLADIEQHRCAGLVVVPVMLQRILELDEEVRSRYDTSSLRIVAASGSALPGELATEWMDAFGDNLYNLYGSTEVANATIATPADMRAAPGTAGKPPRGTTVKILDGRGTPVPQGESGRIFVGNAMLFDGYTGGEDKDRVGGLMATGDVGRFDAAGRLFVEGRDDEMIVSGGENLFPKEVEDTIAAHPGVAEVACIGVDDERFGKRLRAFVVAAGERPDAEEIKAHVKGRLAGYKVPRDVVFVEELPRNSTGKVLKRELAEISV